MSEGSNNKPVRILAAPFQQPKKTPNNSSPRAADGSDVGSGSSNVVPSYIDYRSHEFVELESLDTVDYDTYCGPTPESNWVLPGVMLVGAYPASEDDTETFTLITSILKLGVTKFVCLQQEYAPNATEDMWRYGHSLRPYFKDVQSIVHNKNIIPLFKGYDIVSLDRLSFEHCPIVDCGVTDDSSVINLSLKLVKAIAEGEVLYIHCWGGHGRTGTIVCIMLHLMYGLSAAEAMHRCQTVHDLRQCHVVVGSPQTPSQRAQVTRVVSYFIRTAQAQEQYKAAQRASAAAEAAKAAAASSASSSSAAAAAAHSTLGRPMRTLVTRTDSNRSMSPTSPGLVHNNSPQHRTPPHKHSRKPTDVLLSSLSYKEGSGSGSNPPAKHGGSSSISISKPIINPKIKEGHNRSNSSSDAGIGGGAAGTGTGSGAAVMSLPPLQADSLDSMAGCDGSVVDEAAAATPSSTSAQVGTPLPSFSSSSSSSSNANSMAIAKANAIANTKDAVAGVTSSSSSSSSSSDIGSSVQKHHGIAHYGGGGEQQQQLMMKAGAASSSSSSSSSPAATSSNNNSNNNISERILSVPTTDSVEFGMSQYTYGHHSSNNPVTHPGVHLSAMSDFDREGFLLSPKDSFNLSPSNFTADSSFTSISSPPPKHPYSPSVNNSNNNSFNANFTTSAIAKHSSATAAETQCQQQQQQYPQHHSVHGMILMKKKHTLGRDEDEESIYSQVIAASNSTDEWGINPADAASGGLQVDSGGVGDGGDRKGLSSKDQALDILNSDSFYDASTSRGSLPPTSSSASHTPNNNNNNNSSNNKSNNTAYYASSSDGVATGGKRALSSLNTQTDDDVSYMSGAGNGGGDSGGGVDDDGLLDRNSKLQDRHASLGHSEELMSGGTGGEYYSGARSGLTPSFASTSLSKSTASKTDASSSSTGGSFRANITDSNKSAASSSSSPLSSPPSSSSSSDIRLPEVTGSSSSLTSTSNNSKNVVGGGGGFMSSIRQALLGGDGGVEATATAAAVTEEATVDAHTTTTVSSFSIASSNASRAKVPTPPTGSRSSSNHKRNAGGSNGGSGSGAVFGNRKIEN